MEEFTPHLLYDGTANGLQVNLPFASKHMKWDHVQSGQCINGSLGCPVHAGKGSEIGDFLTQHPAVNCISFTGGDTGISVSKKVSP